MGLVSKSEFARLAGVSSQSVKRATEQGKKPLAPAMIGKQIDVGHPAAVDYVTKFSKTQKLAATKKKTKKAEPVKPKTKKAEPVKDSKKKAEPVAPKKKKTQKVASPKKKAEPVKDSKKKKAESVESDVAEFEVSEEIKTIPARNGNSINEVLKLIESQESAEAKFDVMRTFVHKIMIGFVPDDIRELADKSLNELTMTFGTDIEFGKWLEATKKIEEISDKRIKNAKAIGELIDKRIVTKGIISPLDGFFRTLLSDGSKKIEKDLRVMHKQDKTQEQCEVAVQGMIGKFLKPVKNRIIRSIKAVK